MFCEPASSEQPKDAVEEGEWTNGQDPVEGTKKVALRNITMESFVGV